MFQGLTNNLTRIFNKLTSSGSLTEDQVNITMREIRIALLEADVALPVIKAFISSVKSKALGKEIIASITPAQMVISIIHKELVAILGATNEEMKLNLQSSLANILIVGLQGSGKTTGAAKLALKLKKQNKKVLLVSLDTQRPAAQEQLLILADSISVDSLAIVAGERPLEIVNRAMLYSKNFGYDVVLYDTAGRLEVDDTMMDEIALLKKIIQPLETLLFIDSMTGQVAVSIAHNFDSKLGITGIILSRIDGDSRGGAALSIKYITNKPIKFLSSGEKLLDLEEFNPERIASRILDMGDIISLVEKANSVVDRIEAEKIARKLQKGKFDLEDYLHQMQSIKKLGGFGSIIGFLPGINRIKEKLDQSKIDNDFINQQVAIILSMTKKERMNPNLLNASRKKRIAFGSGTSVQKVNLLLKQFQQLSFFMKNSHKLTKNGALKEGIKHFLK